MKKILIANWKMNPKTEAEAVRLAKAEDISGAVICPPYVFLPAIKKVLKKAKLGAQDAFHKEIGAFTGEVSAKQLKGVGVNYVILGHSERRIHLGETDEQIERKVAGALAAGLTPVLCVGETKEQRQIGQTKEILDRQLRIALAPLRVGHLKKSICIAYEPIWAISTFGGVAAKPEEVLEVIHYIQKITGDLLVPPMILYGGSVDSKNIEQFTDLSGVAGALVGGASLKPAEFKKMSRSVL